MKNFIKGRWFPLTVAAVFGLVVGSILFSCGFRITYDRELESSWAAISAFAAWAGAVGTVAAVFSAIYVANRQNKITLFEKRYKIFKLYDSCTIFSNLLESLNAQNGLNSNDIQVLFLAVFCDIPMGEKINDFRFLRTQYITIIEQLKQSQFLFSREIELHLLKVAKCLKALTDAICDLEAENKLKSEAQTFILLLQDKKSEDILNKMKNTLTLH